MFLDFNTAQYNKNIENSVCVGQLFTVELLYFHLIHFYIVGR